MKDYAKAVHTLLEQGETIEDLDRANKLALQRNMITLHEYQEAAQVLVHWWLYRK